MKRSKVRLALAVVLSLFMVVGLLETPFVASRLAPTAFWNTYCARARKKVVSATSDLRKCDDKIERLKASLDFDKDKEDELDRLEASRLLIFEHKKMMEEKMLQLEGERNKALGMFQNRGRASLKNPSASSKLN